VVQEVLSACERQRTGVRKLRPRRGRAASASTSDDVGNGSKDGADPAHLILQGGHASGGEAGEGEGDGEEEGEEGDESDPPHGGGSGSKGPGGGGAGEKGKGVGGRRRQMVLISATMPRQLAEFASVGSLKHHVLVRLDTEHILSKTLKVGHYLVLPADRCVRVRMGVDLVLSLTDSFSLKHTNTHTHTHTHHFAHIQTPTRTHPHPHRLSALLFLLKDVMFPTTLSSTAPTPSHTDFEIRPLPWDVADEQGLTKGFLGLKSRENLFRPDLDGDGGGVPSVPSVAPHAAAERAEGVKEDVGRRKRCMVFCATRHSVNWI